MSDTGAPERTGVDRNADVDKAPLAERLQSKIATAARDYKANAAVRKDGSAAVVAPAAPEARTASGPTKRQASRGPRRARLKLTRIDPWSVMKVSFLLSVAYGIVTVVAVAVVWSVLGAAGVWDSINTTVQNVIGGQDGSTFDITSYISTSRVMGFTMLVSAVDVVLLTAIATLLAFLYNMSASLLGGIELTLAEDPH